jgi:hypothetical protein
LGKENETVKAPVAKFEKLALDVVLKLRGSDLLAVV